MPRKKPRRIGPKAASDPVTQPPLVPAAPPPGNPSETRRFRYQFEKDEAAEPTLTAREEEIVGYVAKGLENLDISKQLGTSERTVEKHMKSIRAKLGTKTRTALVVRHYEEKLRASETRNAALETENKVLKTLVRELGG